MDKLDLVDSCITRQLLETVSSDSNNLSNVVNNVVFKKNLYKKLLEKLYAKKSKVLITKVSTNILVSKIKYDSGKHNLAKMIEDVDKKIPDPIKLLIPKTLID